MDNDAEESKSPRGRPPEFTRAAVVAAAVDVFWSKGFKGATLDDLEAATGVDRSSLYNSFGGKNGLYRSAAAAYVAQADLQLFEPLHHGTGGLTDIIEFIDRLAVGHRSTAPKGCFIVNDMGTGAEHDETHRYLQRLSGGFTAALNRAAAEGQINPDQIQQRQQFLTAAFIGLSLIHGNISTSDSSRALVSGIRNEVRSWAHPPDHQVDR